MNNDTDDTLTEIAYQLENILNIIFATGIGTLAGFGALFAAHIDGASAYSFIPVGLFIGALTAVYVTLEQREAMTLRYVFEGYDLELVEKGEKN